jgi:hypothetical protein
MRTLALAVLAAACTVMAPVRDAQAQTLSAAMKVKVDAKMTEFVAWGKDPLVVSAVKAHNASPAPEMLAMTNEKWASLTKLDPFVRSFDKNPLGQYLKSKKDDIIAECFVSGADGTKVAFLAKTTNWSHKGKDKHMVPMSGKTWIGPIEVDESDGQQQVQVAVPVLDAGKPIGSIVVGLKVSQLK